MKQCIAVACLAAVASLPAASGAQGTRVVVGRGTLAALGGDAEDRRRVDQLLGRAPADSFSLLRAPSVGTAPLAAAPFGGGDTVRVEPLLPSVLVTYNSALPFSLNDGALWAGRGTSASVTGGARLRYRFVTAVVAPTFAYAENQDFPLPSEGVQPTAPPPPTPRSPYGYPWRVYGLSIDYPIRFGDGAYRRLDFGQSALYASLGGFEAGWSAENEWWGPGVRNAIVMSNNAPGVPRLFVRTARPVRTRVGTVEGRYSLGTLGTSPYFEEIDPPPTRGRSLNTLAVSVRPNWAPDLTLGFTRAVFAQLRGAEGLEHALDVFARTGRPNARPNTDPTQFRGRDQVYSLFARYVLPGDGFESWAEWSRTEFPVNLRDALVAPNHTQGYTLGAQYARPVAAMRGPVVARVQAEITNISQSATYRDRPIGSYYASRAVIEGYTQRGQVLGAAVGPGGAGQWLAADALASGWSGGLFAGRIVWDDDALYSGNGPQGYTSCRHDVSVFGGVRGGVRTRHGTVGTAVSWGRRLNPYYRIGGYCLSGTDDRHDRRNFSMSFTYTPPGAR